MPQKKRIHKPYKKLKGFLCERCLTYEQIGQVLGVTPTTVSQKINGYSDFYLSEVQKIQAAFGATNDIFV